MITFLTLIALPTLVAALVLLVFKTEITFGEFGLQVGAAVLIVLAGMYLSYEGRIADTELWNGQVTAKDMERVSCSHSYSCHCHTVTHGSGKNQTTSVECDTCYEHPFDQDWRVTASTHDTIHIDRVDSQGLDTPPRWYRAYVGEPFTSQHSFDNYILASPGSVLLGGKGDVGKFKDLLPGYPTVYDIYHTHHFILQGNYPGFDYKDWDYLVNEANKTLGPSKQVNLIVIVAQTADESYLEALNTKWVGGKKNDAIIVIGSMDGHKIDWAGVVSWTPSETWKVAVRDAITDIGTLDQRDRIMQGVTLITNSDFQRLHMKTMKYLASSADMPVSEQVYTLLFALIVELGLAWWSIKNSIH